MPRKKRNLSEYKDLRNKWDYFLTFLFIATIMVFSISFISATKYKVVRVHLSSTFMDKVPYFFGTGSSPDESLVMTHLVIAERVPDPYNTTEDWYYEILGGSINTQLLATLDNTTGEYDSFFDQRDDWQNEYYQKLMIDDSIDSIHILFLYLNRSSGNYQMISAEVGLFKSTSITISGIAFETEGDPRTAYIDYNSSEKSFFVDLFFNLF